MTRSDGRLPGQLRPVRFHRNWTDQGEGNCVVEFGRTRVLCIASVEPGVPRWRRDSGRGWVTAEYAMLPRSTDSRGARESVKGRLGGRTQEISRLVGRALRAVIDDSALGENTIHLDCDVLQADGGTRTAAINGAFVALVDALAEASKKTGGPAPPGVIRGSVAAISVGLHDDVELLDLDYLEDRDAEVDLNLVMTGAGQFVEVQGTGEEATFSRSQLDRLLKLGKLGIDAVTQKQRQALGGNWPLD